MPKIKYQWNEKEARDYIDNLNQLEDLSSLESMEQTILKNLKVVPLDIMNIRDQIEEIKRQQERAQRSLDQVIGRQATYIDLLLAAEAERRSASKQ